MQPSSSAVSRTKTALVAVLALAAHIGGNVQAQYVNGEEIPLRPEPPAAGKIVQQPAENIATAANNKKAAEEKLPGAGDDLDAYAAAQIVAQAQETHAAKEAAAATQNTETAAATSSPAAPTGGNPNNCSGTLQYKGSTYLFMEHQPCPIPDSVFQRLTPAATSR